MKTMKVEKSTAKFFELGYLDGDNAKQVNLDLWNVCKDILKDNIGTYVWYGIKTKSNGIIAIKRYFTTRKTGIVDYLTPLNPC